MNSNKNFYTNLKMSSETETQIQREILIKIVKQIDLSKLSDSKLRRIINIIIEEEKKPMATIKSDNISSIMEKSYKDAQDIINKVGNQFGMQNFKLQS